PDNNAAQSLDHVVGAGKQRRWHGQAQSLGGLEVDDQLELSRLHNRQIDWLLALENTTGVNTDLTILIGIAAAVADEPASLGELAEFIDRWHPISCRQRYDLIAPADEERIGADDECAGALLDQRCEGRIQ